MSDGSSSKVAMTRSSATFSLAGDKSASPGDDGGCRAQLIRTIEGEIVPRLLVSVLGSMTAAADTPDLDTVAKLAQLLLEREKIAVADVVRMISPPETPLDRKCLGLIAPVARRLGELWERDECDIDQVITGLSLLELVIREVSGSAP
jgi:MerR family transcriptional regulator, light-induced transcriptional regulator